MARSPSSPIILPCPAKRVSAFSVVDGSVYRPPRVKCAPSPDRGIDNSVLSAQMDLTLFVYTHRSFRPARKSQRVLGPIADAGQGGAKAQSSPAHGSSLGRLSKNCKKYVSHTYKSKKTPFGTTQQSTRQAPSSSTQTQVEFKLDSSWTQVELQSRRRRKPAEKSVGVSGKVGGGQRRQLQNLPRHRRFHRNRPTCFANIGAILVGRHRRCRRFNEVLQLPLMTRHSLVGIALRAIRNDFTT